MDTNRLTLITRGPLWAITPDSFVTLLGEMSSGRFFADQKYALLKPTALGDSRANKVSVIPVNGVLTKDAPWAGTTYPWISDAVEQAAADPAVKRIVLAVDSPGGEVSGLPETAAVLSQVARAKPLHAVVEGTSASAAFWLTSQATDITLAPSAEVGSVGVRMLHMDISKMLDKAGVTPTEISAGAFKMEWSPFKPLTDEAKADMQDRLDEVHSQFVNALSKGRGLRASREMRLGKFGEGRMFSAKEALRHGLADAVQAPRAFYRSIVTRDGESTSTPVLPTAAPGLQELRARLNVEVQRNRRF